MEFVLTVKPIPPVCERGEMCVVFFFFFLLTCEQITAMVTPDAFGPSLPANLHETTLHSKPIDCSIARQKAGKKTGPPNEQPAH
jgi:hypothetical protein